MSATLFHNIKDRNRPKIKKEPVRPEKYDENLALSTVPDGVLQLENVQGYLSCRVENMEQLELNDEHKLLYTDDMSAKPGYEHLDNNDIVNYSLKHEFDDETNTKIILSRIHDGKFWMEDRVIDITADLIHEVTGLSKEGEMPLNEKKIKNVVLENTGSSYNGRGIVITKIRQDDVRYLCKILTTKFCANSREDDMAVGLVHAAYLMCVEKKKIDLCEILRIQLFENLDRIKKVKNTQFRFSSLITYIFFHIYRRFPFTTDWSDGKTTI